MSGTDQRCRRKKLKPSAVAMHTGSRALPKMPRTWPDSEQDQRQAGDQSYEPSRQQRGAGWTPEVGKCAILQSTATVSFHHHPQAGAKGLRRRRHSSRCSSGSSMNPRTLNFKTEMAFVPKSATPSAKSRPGAPKKRQKNRPRLLVRFSVWHLRVLALRDLGSVSRVRLRGMLESSCWCY